MGDALARAEGRPVVAEFPLRLLAPFSEDEVQGTVRLALDECARLIAEANGR